MEEISKYLSTPKFENNLNLRHYFERTIFYYQHDCQNYMLKEKMVLAVCYKFMNVKTGEATNLN